MAGSDASHWDRAFTERGPSERSWHQDRPDVSLRLIRSVAGPRSSVVDVGGGDAHLVDELCAEGFTDLTVVDVSQRALDGVTERLDGRVRTVQADVRRWVPDQTYDVWHDRAAFHFLIDDADRDRYVRIAASSIPVGGSLVLGTFAEDGPTTCSGLPVRRYDTAELAAMFAPDFVVVHAEREEHRTPGGAVQPFTWVVLRREP